MKLLFDHVEKCGGRTVIEYLKSCFSEDDSIIITGNDPGKAINDASSEPTKDMVAGHYAIYLSHMFPDHLKTTVLREPVSRVVSLFLFCKQEGHIPMTMGVWEFIQKPIARNYYAWRFSGIPSKMLPTCQDLAVDRAVSVLSSYDRVGFTDNIEGFVMSLGLEKEYVRTIHNKTRYYEAVSVDDIQLIRDANQLDTIIYERMKH